MDWNKLEEAVHRHAESFLTIPNNENNYNSINSNGNSYGNNYNSSVTDSKSNYYPNLENSILDQIRIPQLEQLPNAQIGNSTLAVNSGHNNRKESNRLNELEYKVLQLTQELNDMKRVMNNNINEQLESIQYDLVDIKNIHSVADHNYTELRSQVKTISIDMDHLHNQTEHYSSDYTSKEVFDTFITNTYQQLKSLSTTTDQATTKSIKAIALFESLINALIKINSTTNRNNSHDEGTSNSSINVHIDYLTTITGDIHQEQVSRLLYESIQNILNNIVENYIEETIINNIKPSIELMLNKINEKQDQFEQKNREFTTAITTSNHHMNNKIKELETLTHDTKKFVCSDSYVSLQTTTKKNNKQIQELQQQAEIITSDNKYLRDSLTSQRELMEEVLSFQKKNQKIIVAIDSMKDEQNVIKKKLELYEEEYKKVNEKLYEESNNNSEKFIHLDNDILQLNSTIHELRTYFTNSVDSLHKSITNSYDETKDYIDEQVNNLQINIHAVETNNVAAIQNLRDENVHVVNNMLLPLQEEVKSLAETANDYNDSISKRITTIHEELMDSIEDQNDRVTMLIDTKTSQYLVELQEIINNNSENILRQVYANKNEITLINDTITRSNLDFNERIHDLMNNYNDLDKKFELSIDETNSKINNMEDDVYIRLNNIEDESNSNLEHLKSDLIIIINSKYAEIKSTITHVEEDVNTNISNITKLNQDISDINNTQLQTVNSELRRIRQDLTDYSDEMAVKFLNENNKLENSVKNQIDLLDKELMLKINENNNVINTKINTIITNNITSLQQAVESMKIANNTELKKVQNEIQKNMDNIARIELEYQIKIHAVETQISENSDHQSTIMQELSDELDHKIKLLKDKVTTDYNSLESTNSQLANGINSRITAISNDILVINTDVTNMKENIQNNYSMINNNIEHINEHKNRLKAHELKVDQDLKTQLSIIEKNKLATNESMSTIAQHLLELSHVQEQQQLESSSIIEELQNVESSLQESINGKVSIENFNSNSKNTDDSVNEVKEEVEQLNNKLSMLENQLLSMEESVVNNTKTAASTDDYAQMNYPSY